jgi:hypothetical protein
MRLSVSITFSLPKGLLDKGCDLTALKWSIRGEGSFHGWRLERAFRQIQHLKQGTVKGNQIFPDQAVSGLNILIKADLKKGANGVIGVKGQTKAI